MTTESPEALKAHVALHVRNVEQSAAFYRKLFGIEPSKVRPGYAKFDVSNPPLNFTLNETPSAAARRALASRYSSPFDRRRARGARAMDARRSGDAR